MKSGSTSGNITPENLLEGAPSGRPLIGPFLIVDVINAVNYVVQRSPKANKQVVHVDKLKRCYSETRSPWTTDRPVIDDVEGTERGVVPSGQVDDVADEASMIADCALPSPDRGTIIPITTYADATSPELEDPRSKPSLRRRDRIQMPLRYR